MIDMRSQIAALVGLSLTLLVGPGCRAAPEAVAAAAIGTAVGLTGSAVSRASGGCYAACTVGTICNEATGLCEALPCRDRCRTDEVCDVSGKEPRCLPKTAIPAAQLTTDPHGYRPPTLIDPKTGLPAPPNAPP